MFHIYVWCLVYMEIRTVVHDHNSLLSPSSYSHKLTHYNKNGSKNTNKRSLNFFHNIISVWHYYIMSVEIEVTYNIVAVDHRRPSYDLISHLLTYFLASSSFKNNSNNNFNNKFRKTLLELGVIKIPNFSWKIFKLNKQVHGAIYAVSYSFILWVLKGWYWIKKNYDIS